MRHITGENAQKCSGLVCTVCSRLVQLGHLELPDCVRARGSVGVPQRARNPGVTEVPVAHEIAALRCGEGPAPGVDAVLHHARRLLPLTLVRPHYVYAPQVRRYCSRCRFKGTSVDREREDLRLGGKQINYTDHLVMMLHRLGTIRARRS